MFFHLFSLSPVRETNKRCLVAVGRVTVRWRNNLLRIVYQGWLEYLLLYGETCSSLLLAPQLFFQAAITVCPPVSALATRLLKEGRACVLIISSPPPPSACHSDHHRASTQKVLVSREKRKTTMPKPCVLSKDSLRAPSSLTRGWDPSQKSMELFLESRLSEGIRT